MASAAQRAPKRDLEPHWRDKLALSLRRFVRRSSGALLTAVSIALVLALATHSSVDPSLSTAAGGPPSNWLGAFGSYTSDFLLLLFGPPSALLLPVTALTGLRMMWGTHAPHLGRSLTIAALGIGLIGIAAAMLAGSAVSGLPAGWGGLVGLGGAHGLDALLGMISNPSIAGPLRLSLIALLAIGGLVTGWFGLGISEDERAWASDRVRRDPGAAARPLRRTQMRKGADDEERLATPPRSRPSVAVADPAQPVAAAARPGRKGKAVAAGQASLALGDSYVLPSLDLLNPPPAGSKPTVDRAALERNARLLESVLEDFHVRGDIVEVRPGPVVTMYELEPASGIKASRVIQLADDIARNMSALSARVATIPGRSVIGIELPNANRQSVVLSELIGSQAFADQNMSLPLILGKNISGDPVIADLQPMPHLLVAGTTGSGKSVG
ncbi:MAG: DNA translocase FtsK 4TM domain-containing protein, partial [Sphingomicrobium sp.]